MKQPTTSNQELTRLLNRQVVEVVDTPGLRILVVDNTSKLDNFDPNAVASETSAS